MMFRPSDMILIALMVGAAAFTYKTKHEAEKQQTAMMKVERDIRYEEDTIAILKADWSLLTQPGRLQHLVESYDKELELKDVEPTQIVRIEQIPMRPPPPPDPIAEAIAASTPSVDKTVTGALP